MPGPVVVEEVLQTEELSLKYRGVAPVHLYTLLGLRHSDPGELVDTAMSGRSSLNSQLYLGSVAVNDLQDGSLELFLGLLVYVEAVAVVRTEDGGQGELQGPGVSVDSHGVRQREEK